MSASVMAHWRGWFPFWLSQLRVWSTEEALLWICVLVVFLCCVVHLAK